jgi:hypothetical protein
VAREPEPWPSSQQPGALAERPVGGSRAPLARTPALPAASMGTAAVLWHLCVLLVLGTRGRLAGGSGLPGKRRDPRRRARGARGGGGAVPEGPHPAPSEDAARAARAHPASLQSNFWDPPGAPSPRCSAGPWLLEPRGAAAGAGWAEAPGGKT